MDYLTDSDYEVAAKNGIPKQTAYMRFYRRGWSKKRAITVPIQQKKDLWNQYKDISQVSRSGFYYRVERGMPPEKAALTPPMVNQYG